VVTSRGDVHYVVTEFGVAYLHGKPPPARPRPHPNRPPQLPDDLLAAPATFGYLEKPSELLPPEVTNP